jgi:hypothetical protein
VPVIIESDPLAALTRLAGRVTRLTPRECVALGDACAILIEDRFDEVYAAGIALNDAVLAAGRSLPVVSDDELESISRGDAILAPGSDAEAFVSIQAALRRITAAARAHETSNGSAEDATAAVMHTALAVAYADRIGPIHASVLTSAWVQVVGPLP